MKSRLALFLAVLSILLAQTGPSQAASPAKPVVRVLVAENQKLLSVHIKGAYQIRTLDGRVLRQASRLANVAVMPSARGLRVGNEDWPVTGLAFVPAEDGDLILRRSRFRGLVEIRKSKDGTLYAINRLGIESYLRGVLHHEVAVWWPMEALKAQAIAARTYALYQIQVSRAVEYDVKSGTSSQMYGGSTTERYRTNLAVKATAGQALVTSDGKIFPTYFHATCGGTTAGAQELWDIHLPPIAGGVPCGYCRISPHLNWQARVPLSDIEEKLRQNNRPIGRVLKIEPVTRTPSGRIGTLRLTGTDGETTVAAKDFRIWIGGDRMRSTAFTVSLQDDAAWFKGKGWGHGVGLCQWGTLGQALLGRSHETILSFYYPSSKIVRYESLGS